MASVSIEEAQAKLSQLIHRLEPGDELVITENDHPVAKIVMTAAPRPERTLGTLSGTVLYVAPDFDAPLEDFEDSLQ